MPDSEQASALLLLADRDLRALRGMSDREVFADEIFGFHAQQALEKSLKAWLCVLGEQYPRTHDLTALLAQLQARGADVEGFWPLAEYNVFAVQFRYQAFDGDDDPLDRAATLEQVRTLVERVHAEVKAPSAE